VRVHRREPFHDNLGPGNTDREYLSYAETKHSGPVLKALLPRVGDSDTGVCEGAPKALMSRGEWASIITYPVTGKDVTSPEQEMSLSLRNTN